ncbi:MAG: redox-sensing transcriptional repressor Rex [Clostridia bacterium]|nr:redox-sensing transcriptional repressor Rex [Clostridia bacterium]
MEGGKPVANDYISDALIRRLPSYYRHLRELEAEGIEQISSKELGERMHQTPSQVRQDINCFGGVGRQGYGYHVPELKKRVGEILGLDHEHRMIIIGAGSIGSAVARYPSFSNEGFRTIALFDNRPEAIGRQIGDLTVQSTENLERFLDENLVDIAVLAVPKHAAQEVMDRLLAKQVAAVWNFAPTDLQYDPQRCTVVNVHLSDSLHILSYRMAQP